MKQCHFCKEDILDAARKCRYCKSWQPEEIPSAATDGKACVGCGQTILFAAKKCRYCGTWQEPSANRVVDNLSVLERIRRSREVCIGGGFGKSMGLFVLANCGVMAVLTVAFSAVDPDAGIGTFFLLLCFGFALPVLSLLFSKTLAVWRYDIKIINPEQPENEQERYLLALIGALAEKGRLPALPEVGIYPAEEMNAFATGSSKSDAMIAFSQGLLDHMDEESIAGVAAHETAHIANGDMLTMTLLTGLVNIGVMIIDFAMRQMDWYDELRDKSKTLAFIVHVILVNLLFFVGNLLLLWFSRHREFEADETAASLVGNASMSGALKRLMEDDNIGTLTEAGEPIAAMMISAPPAWCDFFSTHPSLERRIQHLLKIS